MDKEEYGPHRKMFEGPVRDTFRSLRFANFEAPDSVLNVVRFG